MYLVADKNLDLPNLFFFFLFGAEEVFYKILWLVLLLLIWQHLSKSFSESGYLKCSLFICYVALLSACRRGWLVYRGWGDGMDGTPQLEACGFPLEGCSWGASGSASCWGAGWSVKFGTIYDAACMIFCNCSEQCCSCINSANIAPLKNWWKQFVCMTTLTCFLASDGMYLCLSAVWPAASPCPGTALPDRCSSDGDVSRSFPPSFPFEEGCGGFCLLLSVHKFGSAVYKAWRKAAGQSMTSCCLGSKLFPYCVPAALKR